MLNQNFVQITSKRISTKTMDNTDGDCSNLLIGRDNVPLIVSRDSLNKVQKVMYLSSRIRMDRAQLKLVYVAIFFFLLFVQIIIVSYPAVGYIYALIVFGGFKCF